MEVVAWEEDQDPFLVLAESLSSSLSSPSTTGGIPQTRLVADDALRYGIVSGLRRAGFDVRPWPAAGVAFAGARRVKTAEECVLLEAVNRFTLALVAALQSNLRIGTTRGEIRRAIHGLFVRAGHGLGDSDWCIVLIGDQAASPHGDASREAEARVLRIGEFVLIDIGSELFGYGSDVTRTILPPEATVPSRLMDVWHLVHRAQTAALERMLDNATCSDVDEASRAVIRDAGWGEFYTHRLGHGLGLEMHEEPYLNGANHACLERGNVVTNEPGVYVTSKQARERGVMDGVGFGIRIEDAILVTADGPRLMSGRRAECPYSP